MSAVHGKGTAVLLDQYDLSAYLNSYSSGRTSEASETTTFGAAAKTYIPGLQDGTISLSGLYDGSAGAVDAVLQAAIGAASRNVLSILPQGAGTIGNRAMVASVDETSYTIEAGVGDLVTASAEMQPSGGVWGGAVLHTLTAETAGGNTTSIDNAASSASGGVANLHVTAFNGTTLTAKVQHSTDNSVWVDLITFTAATAVTAEQLSVTGTVNRYVRVLWTATVTSATFAVAFARK